jgi:aerobic carbon-monoxide dehydrogenase medium subunit
LLRAVHIERTVRHTAHVRLPLRVAGDYPVAIVSLSVSPADAKVRSVVVAIGSVENTPSRWTMVEQYFLENPLDNEVAKTVALGCVDQFNGRDSAEAPGWYRTSVLPVLLQRAVIDIENQRQTNC